jgi:hypothetical protein
MRPPVATRNCSMCVRQNALPDETDFEKLLGPRSDRLQGFPLAICTSGRRAPVAVRPAGSIMRNHELDGYNTYIVIA